MGWGKPNKINSFKKLIWNKNSLGQISNNYYNSSAVSSWFIYLMDSNLEKAVVDSRPAINSYLVNSWILSLFGNNQ